MIYYIKLVVTEVTIAPMKLGFMCIIKSSTVACDYELVSNVMSIIGTGISGI